MGSSKLGAHALEVRPPSDPVAYGALKDATGSIYAGLAFVSVTMLCAGVLIVRLRFVKEAEANIRAAAMAKPAPAA